MSLHKSQGLGFRARQPVRSPQQLRQDWVAAIDIAQRVARSVHGGVFAVPDQGAGDLARLMVALRHLRSDNFPSPAWSARQMASAFLILAQAFVRPEMAPEARLACSAFLGAGGEGLDALLTGLRTAEAQAWRGQTGERDDD